jgi:hypothetical protein
VGGDAPCQRSIVRLGDAESCRHSHGRDARGNALVPLFPAGLPVDGVTHLPLKLIARPACCFDLIVALATRRHQRFLVGRLLIGNR